MTPKSITIERQRDVLLALVSVIILLGSIMIYSSSYLYAKEVYGSSTYFVTKQIMYIFFGVILAFIVSKTKCQFWLKYGTYINIIATMVLALTIIPGISISVKGASRWIQFGSYTFQPGEFVKFTLLIASVSYFDRYSAVTVRRRSIEGFFLLMPLLVLLKQPDFGAFSICFFIIAMACYLSSFPRKYFYTALTTGTLMGVVILFMQSYRVDRILAFLDPWKNAKTSGFQIIQSYLAFANGSFWGKGLGNSSEKLFYLPEAHNDFILSVIGEEMGLVGVVFLIMLFVGFMYLGVKLALSITESSGRLLVSSIIFLIIFQATLNMGVVLGLLPTKGLNLPFVSYGGSSIMANLFGIGIILSALRHQIQMEPRS